MKLAYALTAAVALVPMASAEAALTATGSVTDNYAQVNWTPSTTTYNATGQFTIGSNGPGSVDVHAAESLTISFGGIGQGGAGSLNVSGAGATFNHNAGTFAVGNGNAGTMTVSNGATANVTHISLAEGSATSTGLLEITNATVTTTQNYYAAFSGTGTTNINAGGLLSVNRFSSVSQIGGSQGTINIDGANARMLLKSDFANSNGSGLRLGYGGNGTINVRNGGTLQVAAGTTNHVTFNYGDLTTGNGTLNLQTGGTVDLAGTSSLLKGTGTGTATFNFTGGTLKNALSVGVPVNQQGGTLTAGSSTSSVGTTALLSGYTLGAAGTLLVDVLNGTGVAGTSSDYYSITGLADLDGLISLQLASGFTPTIGQTFNVLTASTIDITGATAGGWGLNVISGGNGQILQAVYVPEPASLAVIGLGAVATLARRRRS